MKSLALVAALLLVAAEPRPFEQAYLAFRAAQEDGDLPAVRRHAEEAWRLVEEELGAHETTAILAQNLLWETIFADPAGSVEVAARALALGEAGFGLGNMTIVQLRVADLLAKAAARPKDDRLRAELAAAVAAELDDAAAPGNFLLQAGRAAAALAARDDDYGGAYDLLTLLSRTMATMEPRPDTLIARTDLDRAAMLMSGKSRFRARAYARSGPALKPRYEDQLQDAHVLIDHIAAQFAPAPSLDEIDPLHADAFAWHGVARALALTAQVQFDPEHEFEGRTPLTELPPLVAGHGSEKGQDDCQIEWRRRSMDYPRAAMRNPQIGAVVIGYHIAEDGRVVEPRILSEVPQARFGRMVLEQVADWQAKTEGVPPDCLRDKIVPVHFTIAL